MRLYVFGILSALLFAGCAAPGTATKQGRETPTPRRDAAEAREITLLVREDTLLPDGELDEYTLYEYESDTLRLGRKQRFDSFNRLTETVTYEYGDGALVRKTTYDEVGEIISYHTYEYGDGGEVLADSLYTGHGVLQTRSTYVYDQEGNRTRWNVYGQGGRLIAYTEYVYLKGRVARRYIFSATDRLREYSTVEYDDRGRKRRETFHYASGRVDRYLRYEYRGEKPVVESTFRPDGRILWKLSYEYDAAGLVRRITYVDARGVIREIIRRMYETRRMRSNSKFGSQ
jgi:hypothetical protein